MTIGAYMIRRLVRAVLALILVALVTYLLFRVLPDATNGARGSLLDYLKSIFLHLNVGYSHRRHSSVLSVIAARLPPTASLVLGALVLWAVIAIPLAIVTAVSRRSRLRNVVGAVALALGSVPAFWLGLLLLYLFASDVGQFPVLPGANSYVPLTVDPGKWLTSLILPWLSILLTQGAIASWSLRRELSRLSESDWLLAARAKGLPERTVVWRHVARVAAAPALKVIGIELGALLGAAVVIETVFAIPGVGMLVYESIRYHDLVTAEGVAVLAGLFMVVVRLALDVVRAMVDPRVRSA